jgi:hypothetical protein
MRFTFFCLLFAFLWCSAPGAQSDAAKLITNPVNRTPADSIALTKAKIQDSIARAKAQRQDFLADSIASIYVTTDSSRKHQFLSHTLAENLSLASVQPAPSAKQNTIMKRGQLRYSRDPWLIAVAAGLLLYTALLNFFFGKDIKNVIRSFYTKNALSQVDKEGGLINSWAFIGLFLLFSLTSGIVLYQLSIYYNYAGYYNLSGFQLFISFSLLVSLLFALKFVVLKFVGFVFDVNHIVSEYIAIINLTYFNIAFVLLAVAVCFSLLADQFIPRLLIFALGSIGIIFIWQYLRNSINVISNFRFHKFYLFVYLCALEICPVLILIKALDI